MDKLKQRLLSLYDEFPFHRHPLWRMVLAAELTIDQVLRAETQHYLRTKAGQDLRRSAMVNSRSLDPRVFEALLRTYLEECTDDSSGPSHLELIRRLLHLGGVSEAELLNAKLTPGNTAAIALYRDIGMRGAGCHLIGAGVVEHFYSGLSPQIFQAYTAKYGMSAHQAETYSLHGPMDAEHGSRALDALSNIVHAHGEDVVLQSVRDAFVATSLHYDGMLQAGLQKNIYWDGKS